MRCSNELVKCDELTEVSKNQDSEFRLSMVNFMRGRLMPCELGMWTWRDDGVGETMGEVVEPT